MTWGPRSREHHCRPHPVLVPGVLLALLVVLTGCRGDSGGARDDQVASLRADPLASVEVAGLDQVGDSEVSAGEELTGKPRRAQVVRVFAPATGATSARGVRALADAAAEQGWERAGELRSDGFVATKAIGGAPASLTVAADPTAGTVRLTLQL